MSTAVDPSWLPSTVAQSTAALVGIIGGLLVARFMSIDSEQSSLRARRAEAMQRLGFLTRDRDQLEASALRRSAVGVLSRSSVVEELLTTPPPDGPLDTEAFMVAAGIDGWTAEELDPFLTGARDATYGCCRELLEIIEGADDGDGNDDGDGDDGDDEQTWFQVRRRLKLPEDDWDELREEIYAQLKEAVRQQRAAETERQLRRFGAAIPHALLNPPVFPMPDYSGVVSVSESTYNATTRAAERQRRARANDEVKRAQFEFDLADRALRDAALPGSLMTAVWMLAGLTLVGLVLPVVALFALPSYDSYSWRVVVLVAFCVGITALLIYLFASAKRLQPKIDPTRTHDTGTPAQLSAN